MSRLLASLVALGFVVGSAWAIAPLAADPAEVVILLRAGDHDHFDAPVHLEAPIRFSAEVLKAMEQGPVALALMDDGTRIVAQVEQSGDGSDRHRLTWIQPGRFAKGETRRVRLAIDKPLPIPSPWSFEKTDAGALDLARKGKPVFRYNAAPVLAAGLPEIQRRDAYLHPVYTPGGVLATGDFSKFHTHHRGIFLAYAKMKVKGEVVDVWNIHNATIGGKIHHESLGPIQTGPVAASITPRHRWETKKGAPFLSETWKVEVYDIPGAPYWLFDVVSTQTALDAPVERTPYRYGGMAYRGPEPFVKGKLDVLTSEGRGRVDGDQKPTRWVDLTGPISDGSTVYAGAMIADHPGNVNHPTVARIHPTSLPFFSYVPSHEKHQKQPVILEPHKALTFRYRVLIHDGHPDAKLDEAIWSDFARPIEAELAKD